MMSIWWLLAVAFLFVGFCLIVRGQQDWMIWLGGVVAQVGIIGAGALAVTTWAMP